MPNEYHAGFMTKKPDWGRALKHYRRDLVILLTDLVFLASLWMLATYLWYRPERGVLLFLTVPWWMMLSVVAVVAGVWQSFGVSPGMKLMGRRLTDAQALEVGGPSSSQRAGGTALALFQRLQRSLMVLLNPLAALPSLVLGRYVPWHDRLTGFAMVSAAEIVEPRRPWFRRSWSLATALLVVVALSVSVVFTRVDLTKLFTQFDKTEAMRNQIAHPNWGVFLEGGRLLLTTLYMAFMATVFGVVIAAPLSFVAARNLTHGVVGRSVYTVVRGLLSILRAIQPFIWVILFAVWVGPGNSAMAGVMALFIHSVADLTKLYAERLESIDPGPVEAIRASGANGLQVIIYGIIPQIVNPYMSFTIYRWDINVRMSAIVGMIGGGGIGQRLVQEMRVSNYSNAVVFMLLIMIAVWAMDELSARLRERIETGSNSPSLASYALKLKSEIASRGLFRLW